MSIEQDAKLAYGAGLSILPVRDDGSKRPAVETWREYQTPRPTPADPIGAHDEEDEPQVC